LAGGDVAKGREEIRCRQCRKLVVVAEYTRVEFKCPRCGMLNIFVKKADKPVDDHPIGRIDFTA
jgi:phage FluMu protein Com